MPFATLFAIAVALAMDAFAVALATGICLRQAQAAQLLRMAFAFGLFQALMPVAGWVLGLAVRDFIHAYAGWTAFALLAFVGGKMIWEGVKGGEEDDSCPPKDPTRGMQLFVLAVATSIDAMAVGLSFSVLGQSVWFPAVVIGVVCFVITALGVKIGCMAGRVAALSRWAEVLGGVTLLGIGLKIALAG
ncbi:putative manganese efflux pump MntP [Fundidesulfovibrio magnetotacticus]|uniref:Putative manganese efflux pump MntP n=1 Tax=Fundidesulfovibrio magnetotacticus TaxID=2730080 RepID=A0A6V8M2G6_9BACT|nr:manganese efflux pump MntP family protein [Fundidesulfovibrio magnetotacticus]GFK94635.1 putative manganese efflux pump MntP [Fundidesulfovibrio magnetotacticus]